MKITKLTPRRRSIVMVSSLDSTRAMGRIAEDFMVDDYLTSWRNAASRATSSLLKTNLILSAGDRVLIQEKRETLRNGTARRIAKVLECGRWDVLAIIPRLGNAIFSAHWGI
jgi:hypothetical protein